MSDARLGRWLSSSCGVFALATGLLALLGWVTDRPRLTDWLGSGISMQPNTALAAAAGGAALLIGVRRRTWFALLAAVCGLIAVATLWEHAAAVSLGIDTLLFDKDWGTGATVARGRMGPPAAISFTLLALGMFLLLGRSGGRARSVAPALGMAASSLSLLGAIGYMFGAHELYAVPWLTGTAFQTTAILVALGIGLAAAVPEHDPMQQLSEDSAAGMLVRRALPLIVILPVTLAWILLRAGQTGLYDMAMGVSLLVVAFTVLMSAVLWWGVRVVRGRERALAAVDAVRARADMVLRSARDQFVMLDRGWRYTYVNDRVVEITGIPRERWLGRTLWDLYPDQADGPLGRVARRVMEQREAESFEHYYEPWDRWFDTRISPTDDGGIALFVLEITDRKRAEAALRESESRYRATAEALVESDARKNEFLAMLAHELRGPLAPVRNWLEVMKRHHGDPELIERAGLAMERQMGQMVRLIDDLLDVGRITRNRLELRRQRVELRSILEQAIEPSRPLAERKRHELRVELPVEPIELDADPVRLVQVFDNLITNACKFTEPRGRIVIEAFRDGEEAVVKVRDNGRGLPPEDLPRVFEMFSQAHAPTEESQGGLGLGLALVKRLLELHGATVKAASEGIGRGSEFVVRLPALAPDLAPMAPAAPAHAAEPLTAEETALRGTRVLVVDDSQDSAESLALFLGLCGCQTRTAGDGAEAVETARLFRPQVVLLDIGLPRMDGYEACQAIRREPWGAGMVMVALTGWGQQKDRQRSREAGFDHHLVKPVDPTALARLLAEALLSSSQEA